MEHITFRAARVNAQLSAQEAASKMNVSLRTIYSWESGDTQPKMEQLQKLAELYKVDVGLFFAQTYAESVGDGKDG